MKKNLSKIMTVVIILGVIIILSIICLCDYKEPGAAGMAFTPWSCEMCGAIGMNNTTDVPMLCGKCASKTGRCSKCGKIKVF